MFILVEAGLVEDISNESGYQAEIIDILTFLTWEKAKKSYDKMIKCLPEGHDLAIFKYQKNVTEKVYPDY